MTILKTRTCFHCGQFRRKLLFSCCVLRFFSDRKTLKNLEKLSPRRTQLLRELCRVEICRLRKLLEVFYYLRITWLLHLATNSYVDSCIIRSRLHNTSRNFQEFWTPSCHAFPYLLSVPFHWPPPPLGAWHTMWTSPNFLFKNYIKPL